MTFRTSAHETIDPQPGLPLIRANYPSLRPAEKRVADVILAEPAQVTAMSSVELARRADVSDATVIKCCQRLGFGGFSQLKMTLVRELAVTPAGAFGEVTPGDALGEIRDKVFHASIQALNDTSRVLSPESLERATAAIEKSRRVIFFGVGASGIVAQDALLKFMRIGIDCSCYSDSHVQATQASLLTSDDVAVVISHSGLTRDDIDVLQLARETGAFTVCITNHPRSPAALLADVVLLTSAREMDLRSGALTSRLVQLAVVDCLFMAVAVRQYDKSMQLITRTRAAVAGRKV